ncbi:MULTISPECIES: sugar kinase [unclassified Bradyrhizobium]|uniref:sugar kinase n=1 Tax=unclassified Bradyrhizobium TaxID=2631580 RepID=UPI002916A930|nr:MULTISPECIES: sugar kinase [unclassified Bradyrhizobium]
MKIACIGECMVEFAQADGDLFRRGFGGDTLNTALYLSRLGIDTSYVTALGDDPLSEMMLAAWRAEGIKTDEVMCISGRVPGLYMIERDAKGERSFLYWRDRAPARELFDRADDAMLDRLAGFDWLYFSGISLSLYGETGRARLRELLVATRERGGRVAFDGNYRPRGWADKQAAQRAFDAILPSVDLALPTLEDEQMLFGDATADACMERLKAIGVSEIVVKRGPLGCLIHAGGKRTEVPPHQVVQPIDTTAAGDSFNAGYLAARINGASPGDAAHTGHRLAAAVIMAPGAVIPRAAMPQRIFEREQ